MEDAQGKTITLTLDAEEAAQVQDAVGIYMSALTTCIDQGMAVVPHNPYAGVCRAYIRMMGYAAGHKDAAGNLVSESLVAAIFSAKYQERMNVLQTALEGAVEKALKKTV